MDVAPTAPAMDRAQFLDWVVRQELRFEFDGTGPVPIQGVSINHNQIGINIQAALRSRLKGTGWRVLGPEVGIATKRQNVRYPDVVVSRAALGGRDLLVPEVVVVFEVTSPGNIRNDRVTKVREYLTVPSIQVYCIVEQDGAAITLLEREGASWRASALGTEDELALPMLGITVPVAEFYEETDLLEPPPAA